MADMADIGNSFIEAIMDLQYLTTHQLVEIVLYTGWAAYIGYNLSHNWHDAIFGGVSVFVIHMRGLMQKGPSNSPKKLAKIQQQMLLEQSQPVHSDEFDINKVEAEGRKELAELKATKPANTTDEVVTSFLDEAILHA